MVLVLIDLLEFLAFIPQRYSWCFFVVVVVFRCFLILTYFFTFSVKIKLYTLTVNHNYITYLDNFLIMTTWLYFTPTLSNNAGVYGTGYITWWSANPQNQPLSIYLSLFRFILCFLVTFYICHSLLGFFFVKPRRVDFQSLEAWAWLLARFPAFVSPLGYIFRRLFLALVWTHLFQLQAVA